MLPKLLTTFQNVTQCMMRSDTYAIAAKIKLYLIQWHINGEHHTSFPQKGAPHRIQPGLDILRKYFLEIWAVLGTCLIYFLNIFAISGENSYFKMIKHAYNGLINCFSQDIIGNLVKFNLSIVAKRVSFSVTSLLEKDKKQSLLGKCEHIFFCCCNFIVVCTVIFQPFEKYVVGCLS